MKTVYKLFLLLLICTLIGLLSACVIPFISPTVDRMDCLLRGFFISVILFSPRGLISLGLRLFPRIPNFFRANRSNLAHAYPAAFLCSLLCAVIIPVVTTTNWVIVWPALVFVGVIALFLYLQGSFSS